MRTEPVAVSPTVRIVLALNVKESPCKTFRSRSVNLTVSVQKKSSLSTASERAVMTGFELYLSMMSVTRVSDIFPATSNALTWPT